MKWTTTGQSMSIPTSTTRESRSLLGLSSYSTSLPLRTRRISLQSHCLLASMSISSIYWELGMLEGACYRNRWSNIHYYHWSLKNCRIRCTQTYNHSCTSDTTIHGLFTSPERSTSRTNDPIDNWDTYTQLRGAYMHLTWSDQHHSIISPDTQWYHTAHLPISTLETTRTSVDWNPCAYIMRISQLPIEHRPFLCYPLTPYLCL